MEKTNVHVKAKASRFCWLLMLHALGAVNDGDPTSRRQRFRLVSVQVHTNIDFSCYLPHPNVDANATIVSMNAVANIHPASFLQS